MDELGRALTDDLHPEHPAGFQREEHFQHAMFEPHDMAARGFAEARDADLIGDATLLHFFFGHAAGGNLGHGIDAIGVPGALAQGGHAERVAGGDAALLQRGGGEARVADDIARGIDMAELGLVGLAVDLDPAAMIGLEPDGGEVELLRGAHPAGGKEQHFRAHMAAVAHGDLDMVARVLDFLDGRAEAEIDAVFADLMGEFLNERAVDEVEKAVARLDQGDAHVEGCEHRGIFDADDAGADHGEAARDAGQFEELVAVDDGGAVEGHIIGPVGAGAGGDQESVGGEAGGLARLGGHFDGLGASEPRQPVERVDMVAVELMFEHIDLVIERHMQARFEVLRLDVVLHPVGSAIEAAFAPAGEVEHRFAQGFRRDRAGMDRDAAEPVLAVDDQHAAFELAGLNGGRASGGAGADDDEIVMGGTRHGQPRLGQLGATLRGRPQPRKGRERPAPGCLRRGGWVCSHFRRAISRRAPRHGRRRDLP